MQKVFADILSVDFECPHGVAWEESERVVRKARNADKEFSDAKGLIVANKDKNDLWATLETLHRTTTIAIDQHPENTPCWKAKQKLRVVDMYNTLLKKEDEKP